ncbi:MAG: hypothetical protein WBQ60_01650 [Asticcacaulis sp.]
MKCPKCNSEDIYLCSAAHAGGKTTTQHSGTSSGYVGSNYTTMHHESTSESLTDFAKKAAPPVGQLGSAIGFLVVMLIANYIGRTEFHHIPAWVSLMLLALLAYSAWSLFKAVKDVPAEKEAKALWEKSWICKRCSAIFVPEQVGPEA